MLETDETDVFRLTVDALRLVFVDGVFDAAASSISPWRASRSHGLSYAMATDIHWAREVYGVLEARGTKKVARPLTAFNTAYATDGVVIRVTGRPSPACASEICPQVRRLPTRSCTIV